MTKIDAAITALIGSIEKLEEENATLRAERDRLRELFETVAQINWDVLDIDGGDFQDAAARLGLLVSVPASPEIAAEYDCEDMFTWAWSPLADKGEE